MYFLAESFEVGDLPDFVFRERCWSRGMVFLNSMLAADSVGEGHDCKV